MKSEHLLDGKRSFPLSKKKKKNPVSNWFISWLTLNITNLNVYVFK